ncbi:MAG: signal peptidase I [Balneolaceae bacterium]
MTNKEKKSSKARNRRSEEEQKAKHWAREWFDAFIFAAIAAIIIRSFFFGAYRIPTPSMENTLLTGDFLLVSKLAYGPRTPMTVAIPFTDIYMPGVDVPWTRLPGFMDIERNDIVVFNYPIDSGPVSMKTNYIKRAVGMPGDEIEIRDKQLYVNGDPEEGAETIMKHHRVDVRNRIRLSPARIAEAGGRLVQSPQGETNAYIINMTESTAQSIADWSEVEQVEPFVLPPDFPEFSRRNFTFSSGFMNRDHFQPFTVPYSGQEVTLTDENWHIYRNIIERYEGNTVRQEDEAFFINGEETNRYTIQMDYFFMMGDNRDDSEDSRYWGFVPEDHVVGKASIIYFSWNSERWLPRFERIMNRIHR